MNLLDGEGMDQIIFGVYISCIKGPYQLYSQYTSSLDLFIFKNQIIKILSLEISQT